jgi:hypothetical protein
MRMKHWAATGLVLLLLVLLGAWSASSVSGQTSVSGQQPAPADGDIGTRLDRIEKRLARIEEQLKKLEGSKPGWQKVKETGQTVIYIESSTGKVKFVYTDGTSRVIERP